MGWLRRESEARKAMIFYGQKAALPTNEVGWKRRWMSREDAPKEIRPKGRLVFGLAKGL